MNGSIFRHIDSECVVHGPDETSCMEFDCLSGLDLDREKSVGAWTDMAGGDCTD